MFSIPRLKWLPLAGGLLVLTLGFYLRTAGLFRGLPEDVLFHPDEAKQVSALFNYLNGRYVWYVGSLFYDGYPLFLDHVDEWLLRPVFHLRDSLREWVGIPARGLPTREDLFYASRALRVFYGLLVLLMTWPITRRLGLPKPYAFLALFLMAIAPLATTVTHAATGDIATDLFTAAALLCMGAYARRRSRLPLLGAALAAGFAFAGKYQGLLSAGLILIFLLLESLTQERRVAPFVRRLLLVLAGFCGSVLVAIPQFFIDAERTWRDMWDNFIFIKNYNVPSAFLQLPLTERVSQSLANNTSWILQALGWSVIAGALFACVGSGVALVRARRQPAGPDRTLLFAASVGFFPFAALVLSLTGKPHVQAFHFSYLQLPLCLAAVWAVYQGRRSPRQSLRWAAGALALWMTVEWGVRARHENFFWQREELRVVAKALYTELIDEAQVVDKSPQTIRTLKLEDSSLPAFRNSAVKVPVLNGRFWNALGTAPLPSVPLPGDHDWIFLNGPSFPRNDRMFHVPAGPRIARGLIFPDAPTSIVVNIRSGLWPSEITLTMGGQEQTVRLAAYETQELVFEAPFKQQWLVSNSCFVACTARSWVGDTWITILLNPRDAENERLWSGIGPLPSQPIPEVADRLLASAKYLEGTNCIGSYLQDNKVLILNENTPLAAGIYRLDCEVFPLSTNTRVELSATDLLLGTSAVQYLSLSVPSTKPLTISRIFSKAFVPSTVDLKLHCVTGTCRLGRWQLKPESTQIIAALNQGRVNGQKPTWLRALPMEVSATMPGAYAGIRFGDSVELVDVQIPSTLASNSITLHCAMKLDRFPFHHFDEYFVFVHLVDSKEELKAVVTIPLWQATASEKHRYPVQWRVPEDLPRGEYSLWLGIYNGRTEQRLGIEIPSRFNLPIEDDKVLIGHTSK